MRASTSDGKRLKRLALNFAKAYSDRTWKGHTDPEDWPGIERRLSKAQKALYDEIDRLTQIDLTPRAILERD